MRAAIAAAIFCVVGLLAGFAGAQQATTASVLNLGDAVVSGFSGTVAPDPTLPLPAGKTAIDLTFIDAGGSSARIVDVRQAGKTWTHTCSRRSTRLTSTPLMSARSSASRSMIRRSRTSISRRPRPSD
ncbi:MAG: hypothetical protein WDM84_05780 [Bauldia sp.]